MGSQECQNTGAHTNTEPGFASCNHSSCSYWPLRHFFPQSFQCKWGGQNFQCCHLCKIAKFISKQYGFKLLDNSQQKDNFQKCSLFSTNFPFCYPPSTAILTSSIHLIRWIKCPPLCLWLRPGLLRFPGSRRSSGTSLSSLLHSRRWR